MSDNNLNNDEIPNKNKHLLKNKFNISFPKIGLRNIKTAISATLCALIYMLVGRNPTFACIGAVFGMDNNMGSPWKTGGNRLIGTIIGGFLGMGFFYLSQISNSKILQILTLFIGIILLIYISQLLNFSGAIQAGSVVFYIIMLNTPENEYVSYALNRMLDTGIGVVMSVFINWIHIKKLSKTDTVFEKNEVIEQG